MKFRPGKGGIFVLYNHFQPINDRVCSKNLAENDSIALIDQPFLQNVMGKNCAMEAFGGVKNQKKKVPS